MSFILDALKKSDAERQRKDTPGIADVPHGRGNRGGAKWLWLIGGLLAVNLLVLLGLILKPGEVRVGDVPEAPAELPAVDEAQQRSFSELVAEARRRQPVTAPGPAADQPPTGNASAGEQEPPPRQTAPVVADGPPAFDDLRAAGTLSLPDLHLDIHVYSATPAERFVFVNMNKYRENATLVEGPFVREITPDGVILDHRGTTFLLPRE